MYRVRVRLPVTAVLQTSGPKCNVLIHCVCGQARHALHHCCHSNLESQNSEISMSCGKVVCLNMQVN